MAAQTSLPGFAPAAATDRLFLAVFPDQATVPRLSALGVRHVINLALADSPGGLADEDALLAVAGLRYTHIPVPFGAPTEKHYQAFRAAFEAKSPLEKFLREIPIRLITHPTPGLIGCAAVAAHW